MNYQPITQEIGILSVLQSLASAPQDILTDASKSYPLQSDMSNIDSYIEEIVQNLISLNKSRLLFTLPEIALLDKLSDSKWKGNAIIALPFDMDEESCERIKANMPSKLKVEIIKEGEFPKDFTPQNGAIIDVGFVFEGYHLILKSSYRMMSIYYPSFWGDRILFSCLPGGSFVRPINWIPAEPEFFTKIFARC